MPVPEQTRAVVAPAEMLPDGPWRHGRRGTARNICYPFDDVVRNVQKQVVHCTSIDVSAPCKAPPPLAPPRRAGEPPLSLGSRAGGGNGTASALVPLPPRGRYRASDGARRGGEGTGVGGAMDRNRFTYSSTCPNGRIPGSSAAQTASKITADGRI